MLRMLAVRLLPFLPYLVVNLIGLFACMLSGGWCVFSYQYGFVSYQVLLSTSMRAAAKAMRKYGSAETGFYKVKRGYKPRLRLGLEIVFNSSRIICLVFMMAILLILAWYGVFHGAWMIVGVFLSSISSIVYGVIRAYINE